MKTAFIYAYLTFLLLPLSFTVKAAEKIEGYICISEKSTGFSFNKATKEWVITRFNVNDEKFVLTKNEGIWNWKKLGESASLFVCDDDFNGSGYLRCRGIGDEITFNKKNLRFMSFYRIGYVSAGIVGTEGGDTPNITIGKCASM